MYKGYMLQANEPGLCNLLSGMRYKEIPADVSTSLSDYLLKGGVFDGSKVEDEFFPQSLQFDVFISHFHRDREKAQELATYLHDFFGLRVFLDFQYWGCYTELLEKIDRRYNWYVGYKNYGFSPGELMDYEKCRFSASVMHMMLGVALARIIQNTECIFFLYSEQEKLSDLHGQSLDEIEIGSPWVYHELWMTKMLADSGKRSARNLRKVKAIVEEFNPKFKAPVKQLMPIDSAVMIRWKQVFFGKDADNNFSLEAGDALDVLYSLTG